MERFSSSQLVTALYFTLLCTITLTNIYQGAITKLLQDQTKVIERQVTTVEYEPVITICRMPGLKKRLAYGPMDNEENVNAMSNGNVFEYLYRSNDVIRTTIINNKSLNLNIWKNQLSDMSMLGNCFSLNVADVKSTYNLTHLTKMNFKIELSNESNGSDGNLSFYTVQVYEAGIEVLAGMKNIDEAETPLHIVRPKQALMFNVKPKRVKRMQNCNPEPGYNMSFCMWQKITEKIQNEHCSMSVFDDKRCPLHDLLKFGNNLFWFKIDGYKRLVSSTDCQLPCERVVYEMKKVFEMESRYFTYDRIQIPYSDRNILELRYYHDDTMTEFTEIKAYDKSMLLSDIGGNLGLFLGISFWTVRDWMIKLIEKLIRTL